MIKIDKKFVKNACELVFEDLGFYSDKKYRTDFVHSSDFYNCLFNKFPFLLDDDDLFDDFDNLLFDSVLNSLHFNYLNATNGEGFFVVCRMSSLKRFLFINDGLYDIYNDVVTYFSNGKKIHCFLSELY